MNTNIKREDLVKAWDEAYRVHDEAYGLYNEAHRACGEAYGLYNEAHRACGEAGRALIDFDNLNRQGV